MARTITVFGAGYVGLVTGVALAHSGHDVTVLDVDDVKIAELSAGRPTIYEPGLDELISEGIAEGRLRFAHAGRVERLSDIVVVAVGTPTTSTGSANMSYVRAVVDRISDIAAPGTIAVMKSTVPPGTGRRLAAKLAERGCAYVSNPEFLREGTALTDWYRTDRIVIGGTPEAVEAVSELYADIEAPVLACDVTSAEMIKYASNAFLATKISFINEIASLCDRMGAQIDSVATGVGMDRRIGPDFLAAGIGYGGSCFPKDTRALDFIATINGGQFPMLRAVIDVNARQRLLPVRSLKEHFGDLDGRRIAVIGLTFKPFTDDTREAPATEIVSLLLAEGAEVVGYNPIPVPLDEPMAVLASSLEAAVSGADAVVIATEWPEVAQADWPALVSTMRGERVVFDGRNCLDPVGIRDAGATYIGVGRPDPRD